MLNDDICWNRSNFNAGRISAVILCQCKRNHDEQGYGYKTENRISIHHSDLLSTLSSHVYTILEVRYAFQPCLTYAEPSHYWRLAGCLTMMGIKSSIAVQPFSLYTHLL